MQRLWWNKGPDGTTVRAFLSEGALYSAIITLKPDTIAIFHNHPNPDPSLYQMNQPSEADLIHARFYNDLCGKLGVNLLEFICERGSPHLYYAGFVDTMIPIRTIIFEIQQVNGKNIINNYLLRKELKRITLAEQIAGSNRGSAVGQI